jgi:alpha-L-rhamnosidase
MIHILTSYKQYWLSIIIIFSIIACSENQEHKNHIDFQADENTHWITDNRDLPISDSLFYLNNPSPLFRKEFKSENGIENAKLLITSAGYYKASINGNSVGENVLDPAWTDFSKRIYFTEYDVTSLINNGENCIGVTLGNGFYNPLPLRKWGRRNLRTDTSVGKPVLIAKLHIRYQNGESIEIVSDNSWKYNYGPLIKNSVYLGVAYDARKKIEHWDKPGFDDSRWKTAIKGENPGGKLQKAISPPVQITEEISPVEIYSPEEGIYVVDMGVNFTGTYKIKLKGNSGDTLTFRFGERVYDDGTLNPMTTVIGQIKRKGKGGPGAPDIAWQTDSYVIGEDDNQWFTPDFTYHTYRYMEIAGLKYKPSLLDVKGLFIHSNITDNNSFSCSSELLNSIQEATERTFRANLVSVQSDCPAREKFGYGGDLNATSESFIYNYDMQAFYRKTVYDWMDAMNDSSFVDTAPFVGVKYCGISWESAFLTTQYYLYLYYNDTELIKELYDINKKWMEKVARIHPDGLVRKGLSDHESMEPVPVELTGTGHYLQCARIMKTFASVMGDLESEEKYEKMAIKLQGLVKAKFWDKAVTEKINRQTLFATLLYHNIIPDNEEDAAKDSLLNAIKNGPSAHFNTGIFGTKYVLETLSKYASSEEVFAIVNSTAYPGWGHMIDHGATTIWETWKESDNTYSNCHPMFGTVTEWFYRWLAGIQPDPENPGFKEFVLAPTTPQGLDFVNCTYHSPFGAIISNWKKEAGACSYEITVPTGTKAKIILPVTQLQKITIERNNKKLKPEEIEGINSGKFKLDEGSYLIKIINKK